MLGYEKQCSLKEKVSVCRCLLCSVVDGCSLLMRFTFSAADETSLDECPRMARLIMA